MFTLEGPFSLRSNSYLVKLSLYSAKTLQMPFGHSRTLLKRWSYLGCIYGAHYKHFDVGTESGCRMASSEGVAKVYKVGQSKLFSRCDFQEGGGHSRQEMTRGSYTIGFCCSLSMYFRWPPSLFAFNPCFSRDYYKTPLQVTPQLKVRSNIKCLCSLSMSARDRTINSCNANFRQNTFKYIEKVFLEHYSHYSTYRSMSKSGCKTLGILKCR